MKLGVKAAAEVDIFQMLAGGIFERFVWRIVVREKFRKSGEIPGIVVLEV